MNSKRVVVTGLGAVTPLGNSVADFWTNIKNGKSGAARIVKFDPSRFKTQFACEVKDFEPERYLDRNEIKRGDLFTQYAIYAASEAMEDSGIDLDKISAFEFGVIWGSGQGGMTTFEEEVKSYIVGGSEPRFSPFFVPKMITNMAAGLITMKFGLMGISYTTVSACATSNTALMDAYNYIKFGKAKLFVTGGSEAPITEASIGGFGSLKALSTNNDHPEAACRPFDVERDGFVMGEGSAALILEEYEHAKSRGAKIYAEIVGATMTSDAYHMTASHPDGLGAAKSMELAISEAGIAPEKIDYLNAHATSTPVGDLSETRALMKIFGSDTSNLKISGTKSMTGHLLGAAGAIESIICIQAINDGVIPPTINTTQIDPEVDSSLQIVTTEARDAKVNYAMSNAFGFGGHNSTVIFRKI
jgi:3-oxoacyl-[acyl-carrier-protein] synthase II